MATLEELERDVQSVKVQNGMHEQKLMDLTRDVEEMRQENRVIHELGASVRILAEGVTAIKQDVKDVKDDVRTGLNDVRKGQSSLNDKLDIEVDQLKHDIEDVRTQPIKRKSEWMDKIVGLLVGGAVGFVVTMLLEQIFG